MKIKNVQIKFLISVFTASIAVVILTPIKAQAISQMYWADNSTFDLAVKRSPIARKCSPSLPHQSDR